VNAASADLHILGDFPLAEWSVSDAGSVSSGVLATLAPVVLSVMGLILDVSWGAIKARFFMLFKLGP